MLPSFVASSSHIYQYAKGRFCSTTCMKYNKYIQCMKYNKYIQCLKYNMVLSVHEVHTVLL